MPREEKKTAAAEQPPPSRKIGRMRAVNLARQDGRSLASTQDAAQEGREPVGNGQAAAGFSDDFKPGVAAVEGAAGLGAAGAAGLAAAGFFAGAGFLAAGFLAAGFLAAGFLAAAFFGAAFLAAGFLAAAFFFGAAFLAAGFLAAAFFFGAAFLAAGFLAAAFFGAAFLAAGFLAAAFFGAAFFAAGFLAVAISNLLNKVTRKKRHYRNPPKFARTIQGTASRTFECFNDNSVRHRLAETVSRTSRPWLDRWDAMAGHSDKCCLAQCSALRFEARARCCWRRGLA